MMESGHFSPLSKGRLLGAVDNIALRDAAQWTTVGTVGHDGSAGFKRIRGRRDGGPGDWLRELRYFAPRATTITAPTPARVLSIWLPLSRPEDGPPCDLVPRSEAARSARDCTQGTLRPLYRCPQSTEVKLVPEVGRATSGPEAVGYDGQPRVLTRHPRKR